MKKYPHLSLNIHFLTNSQGLKALQKGDLDVFFAVNQKTDKSLRRTVCGKEPLVAIYPYLRQPSDPMQKISLHEFANEPFIAFGKELPTQQLIEAVFKKSQLKLKTTHRFDNVELIKRAVQAGLGCAIVPFSTVKQEALENKLTVKKLNSSELSREAIAITRKEQNPQSNLQTLINFAQRYLFENNSPAPKF